MSDDAKVTVDASKARVQRLALAVVLVGAFLAAAWVASSLYAGILFGVVMAFSVQPVYGWLNKRLHNRRTLSAVITTVLGGTLIIFGGVVVVVIVVRETTALAHVAQEKLAGGVDALVGPRTRAALDFLHVDSTRLVAQLQEQLGNLSGEAAKAAGVLLSATTGVILAMLIALFTMYYTVLEWPELSRRIERVMPLAPEHTRALIREFREVARTAFVGTIATGVVQGAIAGLGFSIVGVPQAFTWGVLTIVASFVPVFGTAMIWGPVAVYLLAVGRPIAAVFVVVWGLGVVMAVSDYVIRPRLVGGRREDHPLLTLLGLLGGIEAFGLPGLIIGPVIMSLFVAVLRIYERDA